MTYEGDSQEAWFEGLRQLQETLARVANIAALPELPQFSPLGVDEGSLSEGAFDPLLAVLTRLAGAQECLAAGTESRWRTFPCPRCGSRLVCAEICPACGHAERKWPPIKDRKCDCCTRPATGADAVYYCDGHKPSIGGDW